MATVRLTVTSGRVSDKLLGTIVPDGMPRTRNVDHAATLSQFASMICSHANVGVKVLEISEERCSLFYEYDMSAGFGDMPRAGVHSGYSFIYTVEPNPSEQGSSVRTIVRTVYALCLANPEVCSHEVTATIAKLREEGDRFENANLRAALEYFATPQAWQGDRLVSAYNEDILGGQPWKTAHDALVGRRVTPLPEAVQMVIDKRRHAPSYLGR